MTIILPGRGSLTAASRVSRMLATVAGDIRSATSFNLLAIRAVETPVGLPGAG